MNTVKHQPATPLPWRDLQGKVQDARGYATELPLQNPTLAVCVTENQHQDSAYIAHTANAYPKLIEALRDAIATTPPNSSFLESRIALLRELGEV